MLLVFFFRLRVDQYVVDVDVAIRRASCYLVDKPLESLARVLQAKSHVRKLVQSKSCGNGSFADVFRVDWYLLISLYQIERGEHSTTLNVVGEVVDVADGVTIWNSPAIQRAEIATWSPTCFVLSCEVKWRGPRAFRGSANAHVQHLVEFVLRDL